MLRIESYVTPIILSYVDKYIKNLKPEDSQVSLWGGDAVFNNLDLRLEVLEQELKLPFSFVNGHIHELRIHVPWTKLTSEPIVITINTIECILKLKDYGGCESESSSQTEHGDPKSPTFRKKQKRQELEAPTSYVQGLISRVINNVSIICNNVILKYVEDDIVLSINAKTLELVAVDRNWESAFTDLSSDDLMLRNLATLTDLTVCLDKRNASGKIESYQEPLLYRCSLSCRAVRQFESIYSMQSIKMRFEVFCPQLHFSLSDTQLPMFLRLIELALALNSKQLQYQPVHEQSLANTLEGEDGLSLEGYNENEDSWSSWMWSLGSSLIVWDESDTLFQSSRHQKLNSVIHLGIYVQVATCIFKLTESVQQESSYYGPAKMHFMPFLKIEQQGSFVSIVCKGMDAISIQLGVSSLSVNPVGNCICGILDTEQATLDGSLQDCSGIFVRSGRESQEFLTRSLFDERILMGARELWDYEFIWDTHLVINTEGSLLEKTGAIGFDLLYVMEIPSDASSDKLSEIMMNPESSNLVEKSVCRIVTGPAEVNVTSGFFHRLAAIEFALRQYEYSPYASNSSDVPSGMLPEEEIFALEANTPTRTYSMCCLESCIKIHVAQHPYVDISKVFNAKKRKRNQKVSSEFCMARVMPVPMLVLKVGRSEIEYTEVMYPQRLVSVAALLRPPTAQMLHNCHSHLSLKLQHLSVSLQNDQGWSVFVMPAFSMAFYKKTLLLPQLWFSLNQPKVEYFAEVDAMTVSGSMPQLLLLYYLINSWTVEIPSPEDLKKHSLVDDAITYVDKFPSLNVKLLFFESKYCETSSLWAGMTTIGSVSVWLCRVNQELYLMSGPETSSDQTQDFSASEKLLKGCFQIPKKATDESVPTVLTIGIAKTSWIVCPPLFHWLKYRPKTTSQSDSSNALFFKRISEVKRWTKSRKNSDLESDALKESSSTTISEACTTSCLGIFCSSEIHDSGVGLIGRDRLVALYPLVKNLLIHIEIETSTLFFSTCVLAISSEIGLVNAVHRIYLTRSEKTALGDTTVVCVPKILLYNSAQKQPLLNQINDVPILLPSSVWSSDRDKLPWSLNLTNFHVYSLQGQGDHVKLPILKPVHTTATLAITPKYQGPALSQIGTVIHLDMSPLNFSGCRRQVESHVMIAENILSLLTLFQNDSETSSISELSEPAITKVVMEKSSKLKAPTMALTRSIHNPTLKEPATDSGVGQGAPPGISQSPRLTKPTSDPTGPLTDNDDLEEKGECVTSVDASEDVGKICSLIMLTAWVQFTVAKVSASLYNHSGVEARKLTAEIEDLTMSVDLQDIYRKLKCKIANFNVVHFSMNTSEWVPGEHEGVIATSGNQLSRGLKIVNITSQPSNATKSPSSNPLLNHCTLMSDNPHHGFLSFTLTMAKCNNIYNKWNQIIRKCIREERVMKDCKIQQYLSEVDIHMQQLDIVFFPQTLHHFITVYEPWLFLKIPKTSLPSSSKRKSSQPLGLNINNLVLPLLYLQTEAIRMFLPSIDVSLDNASGPDLILMQLDSVLISPQVDNPLSRIIIRPDIYSAAQQAKILGVPGSKVEDRQYQIDFIGFSISTGSWYDLVQMKCNRPRSLSCERVWGENPALEWNNYDPTQATTQPQAIHYPLLSKLDAKVLAAPAIVYASLDEEPMLIAGHSLEINATTDIEIFASLTQVSLTIDVLSQVSNSVSLLRKYNNTHLFQNLNIEVLDSGVDCDVSSMEIPGKTAHERPKEETVLLKVPDFVPLELLVTGSKITLNVFQKCLVEGQKVSLKCWQKSKLEQRAKNREKQLSLEVASTESEPSPLRTKVSPFPTDNLKFSTTAKSASYVGDMEDGYDGSEDESTNEPIARSSEPQLRFLPLIYAAVSQPHTYLMCQPHQQKLDISCFDFVLKSVPKGFSIKATEMRKLPNADDYTASWFETRPGDIHPKSGIPPALLMISAHDFLHKPAHICIDVGRPFRLFLSQNKWEQIEHVVSMIQKVIPKQQMIPTNLKHSATVVGSSFSKELMLFLRDKALAVDSISFTTSQMSFNIEAVKNSSNAKSELHTSLSSLNITLASVRKKCSQLSKELVTEFSLKLTVKDLQVKTLYHSLSLQPLIKPLCFGAEMKLSWLHWREQPYVEVQIHSEIAQIDLGPENVLCIVDIYNYLLLFARKFISTVPLPHNLSASNPGKPAQEPLETDENINHLYQDDLRAGIFQFVKNNKGDIFPQPYQVTFNKSSGIMIWCYPEPRALININIFPVPFVSVSTNTLPSSSESVHCVLQYYDVMRGSFVTYQHFQLSESKFVQLDLPGLTEKGRLAVASVWRVCIDYSADDEEIEENDNHAATSLVSPEALALSMKVDSLFSVDILPNIQCLITTKKIELDVINNVNLTGNRLPISIRGYMPDDLIPSVQPFLTLSLDNMLVKTFHWETGHHVKASATCYIHVLNYKFLTNNILLEPCQLSADINFQANESAGKPKCVDISLMMKEMSVHVNQSSVDTLISATKAWHQTRCVVNDVTLGPNEMVRKCLPVIIMTNYIFVNNSIETIRFGQVDTDENLILESGALHLYSWRSHKMPPLLQVCIESAKWKWSDPLCLEYESMQICTINSSNEAPSRFLVIRKNLSPGRMIVTFSGTLHVANIYSEDLEFRVMEKSSSQRDKSNPKNHQHTHLLKSETLSPSLILRDPQSLKVRLHGCQTWSGDIPISLESSKDTFTVKISTRNKKEALSSLCKVYRERIEGGWRILVLFSPHFVVRSHLPRSLTLHVTTPATNSVVKSTIKGRGKWHCLSCDPTMVHHLTFQLSPDLEVSKPPIPISKKLVDQVRHSSCDKSTDINSLLDNLFCGPQDKWPYIDSSFIEGDFLFADQPKIDLQIGFSCLYPSCNTLVVDVRPWALIINHTGTEILLQECDSLQNVWYIPSGIVFAPPKLDNFFSLGVVDKYNENVFCMPLQLSKEERWYTLKFEGRIPRSGATSIHIPLKEKICFLTILSRYEESIQVLHIVPTYSIANATSLPLKVYPMHVRTTDTKIQAPQPLNSTHYSFVAPNSESNETPLLFWDIVQSEQSTTLFEFFSLHLGRQGANGEFLFGHPITVQELKTDIRFNITLPSCSSRDKFVNQPFVVTLHPVSNQVKFVVREDPFPQMILYNNTIATLVFGQSAADNERDLGLIEEELNIFSSLPSLAPAKAAYYTFPCVSSRFPQVITSKTKQPRIHFSQSKVIDKESDSEVVWSPGLDISEKFDQFVSIPDFGDVKIHVERIHHTYHVFVDPASRVEVSAKEIRSRISASKSSSPLPSQVLAKERCPIERKLKEEVVNVNEADRLMLMSLSSMRVFYATFICSKLCIVIKDDIGDSKAITEVIRITLDQLVVHLRPKLLLAERLRALRYKARHQIETIIFFIDAQIDNQLFVNGKYDFPVVLIRQGPRPSLRLPSSEPLERLIQEHRSSALITICLLVETGGMSTISDSNPAAPVSTLQNLEVHIKPLAIYLEDALLYSLRDFFRSFVSYSEPHCSSILIRDDAEEDGGGIFMKLPVSVVAKSRSMTNPFHLRCLLIDDISVLLSVHASAKLYIAIDGSPIHLSPYIRQNVLTTGYALGHDLAMHYLSSALFRAGWVVSSLDLIGNPGGFARTVGSGIRDFVQLPYEGILQGPWAFIAGMTYGSMSLIKHITAGTLVSVTNLANSVARNMEKLSQDKDHSDRSEAQRRIRPSGLTSGFTQGLSSFGVSILGAIGGLIDQPMQAILKEGFSASSLVGGLGRGLVGVIAKPIGGAANLVVHTGQGILRGAGWQSELEPRAHPLIESHSAVPNAPLKYVWKLLVALPSECRQVICAADATLVTSARIYSPVTIILTPQVLYIIGVDEDAHQHAFSLHELVWKAHSGDPTLLFLHKTPSSSSHIPSDDIDEPISGCPERVADYVRSTCSEAPSSDQEDSEAPERVPTVKLFLSPQWRTFLVSSLNIAVRATKGKGFIS